MTATLDLNALTLGQIKEHSAIAASLGEPQSGKHLDGYARDAKVIIRTYSAGVWFGTLAEKAGNEVILTDARRMWLWWAAEGISLSAVSVHGVKSDKSRIVEPVRTVWLEAIEIIPCTAQAIASIEGCPYAQAQ